MADKNFTLHIEGMDKLVADFSKAGVNFRPVFTQAMVKSTERMKNKIQSNIVNQGITFQGNLGRSVVVEQADYNRGVIGVGEKYGGAVEFGRKPGKMPPVAPIERWASLKLGVPGAGYVIARKIKEQGTKANPFVEPAFESESQQVLDYFDQATDVILDMMAGK